MNPTPKPTLADEGIRITSLPHAPFRITHNGRPATLAIIDTETGEVINASPQVARECADIGMEMMVRVWHGKGWIEVINPIETQAA